MLSTYDFIRNFLTKPYKLEEYTNGTHVYMKMRLVSGEIEEINVFLRGDGNHHYVTSIDRKIMFSSGNELEENKTLRQKIIDAFNELY